MAKREKDLEYFGNSLDVKLYAPDGSVFRKPHGGSVMPYISKGYKTKPDAQWNELNEAYEKAKSESLKRSNFQREAKARQAALKIEQENLELEKQMREIDAQLAEAEAKVQAEKQEVNSEEFPAPKKKQGRPKKASV